MELEEEDNKNEESKSKSEKILLYPELYNNMGVLCKILKKTKEAENYFNLAI
jgi:hypothetical protein